MIGLPDRLLLAGDDAIEIENIIVSFCTHRRARITAVVLFLLLLPNPTHTHIRVLINTNCCQQPRELIDNNIIVGVISLIVFFFFRLRKCVVIYFYNDP